MSRLGCSLVPYGVDELRRGVEEAAETGYEGVELSNDHLDGLEKDDLVVLAEAAGSAGLAVAAAGVGFLGLDDRVPTRLQKAALLGARRVVWLPPIRGVAGWDSLDRELGELLSTASHAGIDVSCHVHTGTIVEDVADAVTLVQRQPAARLCFDTAHSGLFDDLTTFVRELGEFVDHVHLRDLRRPPAEVLGGYLPERTDLNVLLRMGADLVPPGEGVLDLGAGLEGLPRTQDWWVVEMEPFDGPEARRSAMERARRVARALLGTPAPADGSGPMARRFR